MHRVLPALALLIGLTGSSAALADGIEFPLVVDGQPVAGLVVGGEDQYLEAALADFLAYVKRISGAELAVQRGTDDLPGPTLHVHRTAFYEQTAAAREDLKPDGFVLVRVGEDLVLTGNLSQGAANGLITLLQDQFGVRWYHDGPLWEVVPASSTLAVRYPANAGETAYRENPSYYRRGLWGGMSSESLARRMRFTHKDVPIPYVGTGHSLSNVVPADKYFDEHPDYFALVDGKRNTDHPCFTHPDMFDVFMDYVRNGGTAFGVNDNCTVCQCERCRAVDGNSEPYCGMPNVSESYFQLIARVAAQTAKEFPDKRLGLFAYQITNAPPRTVEHIGENVDVVLCQDTSQHFDPTYREIDRRMSAEWTRKAGGVSMYDYLGIDYWTPRYFPTLMAGQVRHLARHGVLGWTTHSTTMIESSMPMWYLFHQMLWNVDIDPDAVIERMIADLYGEAAGPMRDFYRHWEDCWTRQKEGRWFWGMDNFMGEMEIYSLADIERGQALLDAAAAQAVDPTVRERIDWLRERFAYTLAAARTYVAAQDALAGKTPKTFEDALAGSYAVADAWTHFAEALRHANRLEGFLSGGWFPKTFRVRVWGLKHLMRDAAPAPLIRWVAENESKLKPERLALAERTFADVCEANLAAIEFCIAQEVDAAAHPPHRNPFPASVAPRVKAAPALTAAAEDWADVPRGDRLDWVFRAHPTDYQAGKYEEPLAEHRIDPPAADDLSARWQAVWDDQALYLRVVVRDDEHRQGQPAEAMWKEDCLQIALDPRRERTAYDIEHSWTYIFGGYHGPELEFGVSLRDGRTETHVWHAPEREPGAASGGRIRAAAARRDGATVYEAAVDWTLLPDFVPGERRSLGICLVAGDQDHGPRKSAEYGGGVVVCKRPVQFAGLRLAP